MSYLHKNLNGYTIMAHAHTPAYGYVILGSRRSGPGTYDYVVASLDFYDTIDTADHWASGDYFTNVEDAYRRYREYTAVRALSEPDSLSGSSLV